MSSSTWRTKEEVADIKTEMMEQFEHVDKQFHALDGRLRDIASEIAVIHRRTSARRDDRSYPTRPVRIVAGYRKDFTRFTAWCAERHLSACPQPPRLAFGEEHHRVT